MKACRGFTLIELLVVVTVLAMVAAIAVPAAAPDYEYRLDLVQRQVEDAVRWARTQAVSTGSPHGVAFDLAGDRFAVVDQTGSAVIDPLTRRDYVVDFLRPGQPKGIDFTLARFGSTGTSVIFDRRGIALFGGSVTLACRNARRTLGLDKVTGKLTVQ